MNYYSISEFEGFDCIDKHKKLYKTTKEVVDFLKTIYKSNMYYGGSRQGDALGGFYEEKPGYFNTIEENYKRFERFLEHDYCPMFILFGGGYKTRNHYYVIDKYDI